MPESVKTLIGFGYIRQIVSHLAQGNCWKKVRIVFLENKLGILEVELEQLFWTNILNVVVQNIELIISARNDELMNMFKWFFNGQYTLQFSHGHGKNQI